MGLRKAWSDAQTQLDDFMFQVVHSLEEMVRQQKEIIAHLEILTGEDLSHDIEEENQI